MECDQEYDQMKLDGKHNEIEHDWESYQMAHHQI